MCRYTSERWALYFWFRTGIAYLTPVYCTCSKPRPEPRRLFFFFSFWVSQRHTSNKPSCSECSGWLFLPLSVTRRRSWLLDCFLYSPVGCNYVMYCTVHIWFFYALSDAVMLTLLLIWLICIRFFFLSIHVKLALLLIILSIYFSKMALFIVTVGLPDRTRTVKAKLKYQITS